jgi:hypothetical protein
MATNDSYEAPMLVEVGDFVELTQGIWTGCPSDWFGRLAWIGC